MTKKFPWAFVVVLIYTLAIRTTAVAGDSHKREVLTNAMVIEFQQLGLGDEIILEKMKDASCSFDVSIESLRQLKAAKVSVAVISEMIRMTRQTAGETGTEKSSVGGGDDPSLRHEPGIYYYDETGTVPKMVMLEPTGYTAAKSGGLLKSALTYGIAKAKAKAVLPGNHASLQLQSRRPLFYFYFEATDSNLGQSGFVGFAGATSANEFVLVRTDIKKNGRELVICEVSILGTKEGVDDKAVQPLDLGKIRKGVYKVTPREDLQAGEYCFFYGSGSAGAGGKVFDFGVVAGEVVAATAP